MVPENVFLFFCLFGGIVAVDNETTWQTLISQPFFACSVAGYLFGDIGLGWTIGVLLQLPFLVELPTGGSKMSYNHTAAYVASGVALSLNRILPDQELQILLCAVVYSLFISWAGVWITRMHHRFNLGLQHSADKAAIAGNTRKITVLNYLSAGVVFIVGVCISGILFWVGLLLIKPLFTDSGLIRGLRLNYLMPVLYGAGVGSIFYLYSKRRLLGFSLLGILIGALILFNL